MRSYLAIVGSAYVLATCCSAVASTVTILYRQCPAIEIALSSVQSCRLGDDEAAMLERVNIPSTRAGQVTASSQGTDTAWISPETGLAHTNNEPACTPHLDYLNDILCVYVYPSFHNGRGLAIFTTPTLATEFTQRAKAIDSQLSTTPDPSLNKPSPHYTVISLPGRGFGALATTSLATDTLISYTTPILLVHSDNSPTSFDRETYLRLAVSLLPNATSTAFHSLARIYHDPRVSHQDIVKANTFAIDISGVQHLALFPEPSRFNHDCGPNAMYHVDSLHLTHTVHLTRALAPGEEITISYLDPFSPTSARRAYLSDAFGFSCDCPRCRDPTHDDAQIAEIWRLEGVLGDWDTSSPAALPWYDYADLAEDLVALYAAQGLEGFMNTAYGHAALAYNSVGESGRATAYARRARDVARRRHGGTGARAVAVWEEFLEMGAWKHWSWRRRMMPATGGMKR